MLRAEELFGAFDGQPLGLVHHFAAAVIALAGQPLGVFVGHDVRHRLGDGGADIVLGGNQLDAVELALLFATDQVGNVGISRFEVVHVHNTSSRSDRSDAGRPRGKPAGG